MSHASHVQPHQQEYDEKKGNFGMFPAIRAASASLPFTKFLHILILSLNAVQNNLN